jgi:hypothetical protein
MSQLPELESGFSVLQLEGQVGVQLKLRRA